MNWQISSLDNITLVSNSDAHSLRKIGREANVFEMDPDRMSYDEVVRIIRGKDPKEFLYTIEFFPEEGKYHLDGHRDCKFSCVPERTRQLGGVCPVCGKKLLVGVLSRVGDLADPSRLRQAEAGREWGFVPPRSVPFKNVIPLEEVIAETFEMGTGSKKVLDMYNKMTDASPEFRVLLEIGEGEIAKISTPEIAKSVMRVREGKVHVEGGYDGVFGKIHIYPDTNSRPNHQSTLF